MVGFYLSHKGRIYGNFVTEAQANDVAQEILGYPSNHDVGVAYLWYGEVTLVEGEAPRASLAPVSLIVRKFGGLPGAELSMKSA